MHLKFPTNERDRNALMQLLAVCHLQIRSSPLSVFVWLKKNFKDYFVTCKNYVKFTFQCSDVKFYQPSHTHPFIYCLWLLLHYKSSWVIVAETICPAKPKILSDFYRKSLLTPDPVNKMICSMGFICYCVFPRKTQNLSRLGYVSSTTAVFVLNMYILICSWTSCSCIQVQEWHCPWGQQPLWCQCPVLRGSSSRVFSSRSNWLVSQFVWTFQEVSCFLGAHVNYPIFFQLLPFLIKSNK